MGKGRWRKGSKSLTKCACSIVKIPKPKTSDDEREDGDDNDGEIANGEGGVPLPQTLVRIPAEQQ